MDNGDKKVLAESFYFKVKFLYMFFQCTGIFYLLYSEKTRKALCVYIWVIILWKSARPSVCSSLKTFSTVIHTIFSKFQLSVPKFGNNFQLPRSSFFFWGYTVPFFFKTHVAHTQQESMGSPAPRWRWHD